jgi:hypothetical protein
MGAHTWHSGCCGDVLSQRAPTTRDVATVSGAVQQWRGWSQKVDSDGDDRSRRPDVTAWLCVSTEKTFEGAAGPLRGRRVLAVRG